MRNITIQNKTYVHMTKINKITSAANQNQPVHRRTESSNFVSLLRAQLVGNNHWYPYMDSEPGTANSVTMWLIRVSNLLIMNINHFGFIFHWKIRHNRTCVICLHSKQLIGGKTVSSQ